MPTPPAPRHPGPDACPGVLQWHQAEDGAVARVRLPGGRLTGEQLAALGRLSRRDGPDGCLELTSRGNLQIRGLHSDPRGFAEALREIGLLPSVTHDRVRNIIASPLSGLDGHGRADLRPLVGELDRALCAAPELAGLPGRFLFVLDDGRGDVGMLHGDLTAVAVSPEQARILAARQEFALQVPLAGVVAAMVAAARAFVAEPAVRAGAVWRLRELAGGPERIAAVIRAQAGRTLAPAAGLGDITDSLTQAGRIPVGVIRQIDGRIALGVLVPLGRLSPVHLDLLAEAAAEGAGEVIVTPWSGVVVPGLLPQLARRITRRLQAHSLDADPRSPFRGVTTCAGESCAKSLGPVRADAQAVTAKLGAGGMPVHWIGCGRGCGTPAGDHLRVLATPAGYTVTRRARTLASQAGLTEVATAIRSAIGRR